MSKRLRIGTRVRVSFGSGINSGKIGTVVDRQKVKTSGRGIPIDVEGAYYPTKKHEEYVRLDTGRLITMPRERLTSLPTAEKGLGCGCDLAESLTYGVLPSKSAFAKKTKHNFPYPMELAGKDRQIVTAVINQGIDSYLEAVRFTQFTGRYPHKLGIKIDDPKSMHTLLRRLLEMEDDDATSLVSGIMGTLGYEWI